jgi:hypothetical protein
VVSIAARSPPESIREVFLAATVATLPSLMGFAILCKYYPGVRIEDKYLRKGPAFRGGNGPEIGANRGGHFLDLLRPAMMWERVGLGFSIDSGGASFFTMLAKDPAE